MLNYVIGDATSPNGSGPKVVAHICNDESKWGRGFVLAVSRKWPQPEAEYRRSQALELGAVQFVQVDPEIYVANMIAQRGIMGTLGMPPIRYPALYSCFDAVANFAKEKGASIHGPKFGAGLAGGDWRVVEAIVEKISVLYSVDVTIYDLPSLSGNKS